MPDVNQVRDTSSSALKSAESSATSAFHAIEEVVQNHPLLAIATVASLGLLLGVTISRKSRPPLRMGKLQRMAGTDFRSRDLLLENINVAQKIELFNTPAETFL